MKKIRFAVLLLCFVALLGTVTSAPAAHAAEPEDFILTCVSDGTTGSKMSGVLEYEDDTEVYQLVVDHSVHPEFTVYAHTSGKGLGSTLFSIDRGGSTSYLQIYATQKNSSYNFSPKGYVDISSTSGEVTTYTITAKAKTDNAGYTLSVGTKDEMAEHLGGRENAATVGRNLQKISDMSQHIVGYTALLNGEGDWYRYTPKTNDATYVGNYIFGDHSTAFEIIDAQSGNRVYHSDIQTDRYLFVDAYTTRTILQNRFVLERGKEYLIHNYTPTGITPAEDYVEYRAYIGLPSVNSVEYSYRTSQSYTVPANKLTTFYIDVTGQPKTYRCDYNTEVRFCVSRYEDNAYITSCKITAPNGKEIDTIFGRDEIEEHPDLVDFLNNSHNIPINGRWKVEILTSKTMRDMHFSIGNYVLRLNRTEAP